MKFVTVADYADLTMAASDVVTRAVELQPTLNIVFPTGHTPIGLYDHLRAEHAVGRFSLNDANVFMLDEYVDLPSYPDGSYQSFLRHHFGEVVFNNFTMFHPLTVGDELTSCRRYDGELTSVGGIDLAIVGVGRNGHVGFNEPKAHPDERTHAIDLTQSTLEANFSGQPDSVRPTRAITMGLRDLLEARSVLMLVAGPFKAPVLAALRDGVVDPFIPATNFLEHQNFTVIADEEALAGA
ncbi:MAG: 6-phosphogluconolactonase [Acidimicrobiales bacterium]